MAAETSQKDDPRARVRTLLAEQATCSDEARRRAIREELVLLQMPLVHHLAGRFKDRGEPLEDLVQVGMIGLIHSIDRFDVSREVEFSTFATPTILGEIKRHFRDRGWAVRVPRRLQELRRSIINATERLTHELGREPTVEELASDLRVGVEDVLEGMEAGAAYSTAPLDPIIESDADSQGLAARLGEIDPGLARVEHRVDLAPLIAELPPREQLILRYRFIEGLTQTEIAERVGISQMHVSRLLSRTLERLRRQLT